MDDTAFVVIIIFLVALINVGVVILLRFLGGGD